MAIKDLIGAGIGFSPGKVGYLITRGLSMRGIIAPTIQGCACGSDSAAFIAMGSDAAAFTATGIDRAVWTATGTDEAC